LLLLAVLPAQPAARAQVSTATAPLVDVSGFYAVNINGFAVINETVTFISNSTGPLAFPTVTIGLGNLSSLAVNTVLAGAKVGGNFSMTSPGPGGPFTVMPNIVGNPSKVSFTISSLVSGEVTVARNGSNRILTLLRPAINVPVQTLKQSIFLPTGTEFGSTPKGFTFAVEPSNDTYSMTATALPGGEPAQTSDTYISTSSGENFYPIFVYQATRTISVGLNGAPTVTDEITLENVGTNPISTLQLAPLAQVNSEITVIPPSEPKLLNPITIQLSGYSFDLTAVLGSTWSADSNLTIAFQYPLSQKYFSTSGSQVTVNIPNTPPLPNVVGSYSVEIVTSPGINLVQGQAQTITGASQRQTGSWTLAYTVALAWAIDGGVPAATLIFILLFVGLFVVRMGGAQEEEETEEESSGERVEAMIKAFDEKTSLINGLWPEISGMDPNELKKEYFDELRVRLDSFRSRALQRLNEVKQKSTTQKFFDLLNQIHTTEREVERAAKDKLNLYEQFYMRRMRKEVFDRLLPQYTKRLEKGLNELSDELHVVQKEAKLL
jgi:hypothetical protein